MALAASNESQLSPGAKASTKVDGRTVPEAYLRRLEISPQEIFIRQKKDGAWQDLSWQGFHDQVLSVYQFYSDAGLKKGNKVAIFSQSRPEWIVADIANFCLGSVTVPIYHSNSVEDVAYILEHSEAKLIFVEDEKSAEKVAEAFKVTKKKIPAVGFFEKKEGFNLFPISYFSDIVKKSGQSMEETLRRNAASHTIDDVATIVYTSGTTGRPKGAVLTHKNIVSELRVVVQELHFQSDDSTLTFLPFAHILGRVESCAPILAGFRLTFAESINTVAKDIGEMAPSILVSVPRIYEKIYAKIQSEVEAQGGAKKQIFQWAVGVGKQVARLRADKKPIPVILNARFVLADTLVLSKIRNKLGGKIRLTVSGGAPLSRDLCEFFHACGIKILEGYGLTETTAAAFVNRPNDYCFGSVGKIFPGNEVKIAEDGEILLRGNLVFREYYNNPEATAEVFTPDGWFCTGDIGEINDRGFLRITDRKKELIVTSGGKKIAPQKLENYLKGSRFISNAMVYGDKQKYIVALICLNEPEAKKWASEKGIDPADYKKFVENPEIIKVIEGELSEVNKQLASYESIKKFMILPQDFTVETGELTPSLKVKRKICTEKFKSYITHMYQ